MLLDVVHIAPEEVVSISRAPGGLKLVVRWSWADLPVLLELPSTPELRWDHLVGTKRGLPCRAFRWSYRPDSRTAGLLEIEIDLPIMAPTARSVAV